jgi:hypothetical protein
MKKLLVLMLVLGMASVANATVLSWSVDAVTIESLSGTAVVQLVADDGIGFVSPKWVGYTPATTSLGSITTITALPAAGGNAAIQNPTQSGWDGWWTVMSMDTETPFTVASGSQYSVTITGYATGTFGLASDSYGTNDTLEVTVLPEPMTVALLGLGGLFLLRRRK